VTDETKTYSKEGLRDDMIKELKYLRKTVDDEKLWLPGAVMEFVTATLWS